jgi:hypothetical protein
VISYFYLYNKDKDKDIPYDILDILFGGVIWGQKFQKNK